MVDDDTTFRLRLDRYGPELLAGLQGAYGDAAPALFERLTGLMRTAFAARPGDLRVLDDARLLTPDWLQKPDTIGYVCYADRFAGSLAGVAERIGHLKSLGVSYLHLMPLLKPREGDSDGGYAVADYRSVDPRLGTMDDLADLAATLRNDGISLVIDLVLNHVAREHEWAARARAGEQTYRDYFHIYPDRTEPDAFERTLPEVFPDFAPGNFTWDDEVQGWVWTTFNSFQWDLNWANPDVFAEFADIVLFLANQGVEVLRLDAIAFIWKELGTDCQNEPPVHDLTQALRAVLRIVAPGVALKAEAIVGPQDLIAYLGQGEHYGKVSDLAYHNSVMVQLWGALASRHTRLFEVALSNFPAKPPSTTWATYARCHDDIGWAIGDADARGAYLEGRSHRAFLSEFYAGDYPGSFARGLVFQHNPVTGDRRISGSLASLAGLEAAIEHDDAGQLADAIARINLLHTFVLGFGGVPLLYMGDEIGMLNDHSYLQDADHAGDNRWVHRPRMDWAEVEAAGANPAGPSGQVLAGLRHTVGVRRRLPQLHAAVESRVLPSPDARVLVLTRDHPEGTLIEVYNFSEDAVELPSYVLHDRLGDVATEQISGYDYSLLPETVRIRPYQPLWLTTRPW
ncbi:amylosucrase [Micropruina sonneratiae]|uniref:amylosucrase n=1 Tax=Micropruina sonneratiae TaxID=2986940 RepID=UPI0022272B74|nr:amylosucrase [Micropruina sp. KQZ13P-5]MCW3158671.1 alpha-amylase family glycosyl hydrolase [Micropruina sp. KQZ13P-5]